MLVEIGGLRIIGNEKDRKMRAFPYPWIRSMIVFGIFLIMATGSVNAGCVGVSTDFICGDTVNESCTFNEHLNCSGDGLIVEADNITLDGNGYTIIGPGRGDEEGIQNEGHNGITIKNLKINEFNFGIYFKDANDCSIVNNSIGYGVGSGIWFMIMLAFTPIWYLDCKLEEKQMTELYGRKYQEYEERTGMFFPRVMKK